MIYSLKFIFFILIFSIVFSCSSEQGLDETHIAEIHLLELRDDIGLWLSSVDSIDLESRKSLELSIFKKTIIVRSMSPDIKNISAKGLEALCLLGKNIDFFDSVEDQEVVAILKGYLSRVEGSVENKILNLQNSFHGKGCYVYPKIGIKQQGGRLSLPLG